jgi:D-psicose/D-tagatose/L-ribulose 3-epimerase
MKFGVSTWVWTAPLIDDDLKTLAPKIANAGFDIIELPLEIENGFDYLLAADLINEYGLSATTCVAMGQDRDLIHPDKSIRDNGKRYVRHCIEAAQIIGATNLVGPLYSAVGRVWQSTDEERAKDSDLLVENLGELAKYAGDHNVTLGVEPLNRFETSFINLAEQAIEIVDRVDHPACKIMLDSFHMNIEEKSAGLAIKAVGPRLCQFHACENDRGAPGSGNVSWDEIADALKETGFDGPVVIESFTSKVQSIARAAAIWRPLAESQDDLAADGLAFLQAKLS